jgi:hypothetical protein
MLKETDMDIYRMTWTREDGRNAELIFGDKESAEAYKVFVESQMGSNIKIERLG